MKFPYWSYFQPEPRPAGTVSWFHVTTLWLQNCLVALISSFQNRNYVRRRNETHDTQQFLVMSRLTWPLYHSDLIFNCLIFYGITKFDNLLIYGQQNFISTIFAKLIPWKVSIAFYVQFLHLSFEPMAPQNTKANHICNYY